MIAPQYSMLNTQSSNIDSLFIDHSLLIDNCKLKIASGGGA